MSEPYRVKRGNPKRYELPLHGSNGVKRWARWHARNVAEPVKIKNPMKYWHSHARRNAVHSQVL